MVFTAAYKVYSTFSGRRFEDDLTEAKEKGFLRVQPHYNTMFSAFENPALSATLTDLIIQSSLPLKTVEVDFAVDSSGFSASRCVKWMDHRHNVERSGHDWVKVHLMCGVKTHIVTAAEIRERNAGDAPLFGPLVQRTAKNFKFNEISADKGYLSENNINIAFDAGAVPFIMFKTNSTPTKGGLWEKMFNFYVLNQDEYMGRYHKRSNVESVFSMIKRKFDDHARSRSTIAMKNEALCKILCHNICCLIQSMYELGVEPSFFTKAIEAK